MQLSVVSESRFLQGPATLDNIDKLMPMGPLRLDTRGWVTLLFGEVDVPADAALTYDDTIGRFILSWPARGTEVRVELDPKTARVQRAITKRPDAEASVVIIEARDDRGLPVALRIKAPEASIDLRIKLRDVEHDPTGLDADAFVLTPPRGVTPEYIGN